MSSEQPNILAIDTSTEQCSVALMLDGREQIISEHIPRQHSQRIFSMLRELLEDGDLRQLGVDLLAYCHGPGSFTGLRIAASAIQGLAYSQNLPVAGVSTLQCIAQGLLRQQRVGEGDEFQLHLDARINEVYWANYRVQSEVLQALSLDSVQALDTLEHPGEGWQVFDQELPDPRDLIQLATEQWRHSHLLQAEQVIPVYIRDDVGWKKLSEQGSR